jgi:hypothetical protein
MLNKPYTLEDAVKELLTMYREVKLKQEKLSEDWNGLDKLLTIDENVKFDWQGAIGEQYWQLDDLAVHLYNEWRQSNRLLIDTKYPHE